MSLFTRTVSKLEGFLQAFADLTILLDLDGSMLEYRFDASHLRDRFPSLLHTRRIQEILSPESAHEFEHQLGQAKAYGETVPFEFSIAAPEQRWFDSRIVPLTETQFLLVARDITSDRCTKNKLEQHVRRLAVLRSIDSAIASGLDLKLLLSMLIDQVADLLSVDAASIWLLTPESNLLTFSSGVGFQTGALQHTRLKLGDGYAGKVAMERKAISIPDLSLNAEGRTRSNWFADERFVAYYGLPLVARGKTLGVLEIFNRTSLRFDSDWVEFLGTISGQAAIAIDNAILFREVQRSNVELSIAYDATIEGWSRTLALRDMEAEEHTRRVTDMTIQLALLMGVAQDSIIHIRRGSILHDLGKVAIPDEILFKPGPLTDEEWQIMRQHPMIAVNLLSPIAYLTPALEIPRWHHERWDGTGYPDKLGGEQIPLAARLFAVADVYDALTCDCLYRSAWSKSDAIQYIESKSGEYFDPRIVVEFMKLVNSSR